jgi:flagellar biosynthesis anti-sigma factor FlgM
MKIENYGSPVNGLGQTPKVNKSKGFKDVLSDALSLTSSNQDQANVSEDAQTMAKALDNLNGSSDVRETQIDMIRSQILSGNYHIDYEGLAKKISSLTWFS